MSNEIKTFDDAKDIVAERHGYNSVSLKQISYGNLADMYDEAAELYAQSIREQAKPQVSEEQVREMIKVVEDYNNDSPIMIHGKLTAAYNISELVALCMDILNKDK